MHEFSRVMNGCTKADYLNLKKEEEGIRNYKISLKIVFYIYFGERASARQKKFK